MSSSFTRTRESGTINNPGAAVGADAEVSPIPALEVPVMGEPTRPEFLKQDERIRWVPGWRGLYAVTDQGRVVSYHGDSPRNLSFSKHPHGYQMVNLCLNGTSKKKPVHSLVLSAFCGERPEGKQCAHNDGDPTNNRLENLRWATPKENSDDILRHGTGIRRFSNDDAREMRERYAEGESTTEIADAFDTSRSHVWGVVTGEKFKDAGGPISKDNRDRRKRGESHPHTDLNKQDVKEIRARYENEDVTQNELAEDYGVCPTNIGCIVRRETWQHVGAENE